MPQLELEQYSQLADLIRTRSYSSEEVSILDLIDTQLLDLKIEHFKQQSNMVVHLSGKNRSKAIFFDGHIDTVSITNEEDWGSHEPYGEKAGEIIESNMYGLGSSDMKSGIFAQMQVLKILKEQRTPPCDVWMLFAAEEETTGAGTKSFVEWFRGQGLSYEDFGLIIPEPTYPFGFCVGQRGNYAIKAVVDGEPGHASLSKTNSIQIMAEFSNALMEAAKTWSESYINDLFGSPKVAFTAIKSGNFTHPNQSSSNCEMAFDIRTNPEVHELIPVLLSEIGSKYGVRLEEIWPPAPTIIANRDSRLVKILENIHHMRGSIYPAATDIGWFINSGLTNEVVIYGPGDLRLAHMPKEYVNLEMVDKAINDYKRIIELWSE